jgi:hypothetical protein
MIMSAVAVFICPVVYHTVQTQHDPAGAGS